MTCMDLNRFMIPRNSRAWVAVRIKHWTHFSTNLDRSQVKPTFTQETNKGVQPQPSEERTGLVRLQEVASFQGGKREGAFSRNPTRVSEICPFIVNYTDSR